MLKVARREVVSNIRYNFLSLSISRKCSAGSDRLRRGAAAVSSKPCPSAPVPQNTSPPVSIELVQQLEKLSLVDVANKAGLRALNYTISLADRLQNVKTGSVVPLLTLHENRCLTLAEDEPECLTSEERDRLLSCASDFWEDYFVVPPGNIDYIPDENYYCNLLVDTEEQTFKADPQDNP